MDELIAILVAVFTDWRVIAATIGTAVVWALFRNVGLVYRKPKALVAAREKTKAAAKEARARPAAAEEEEGEEAMVE